MQKFGRGILDVINKTSKLKKQKFDEDELMMMDDDEEEGVMKLDPYEVESERASDEPDEHYSNRMRSLQRHKGRSPNAIPNEYYDEFYKRGEEGVFKENFSKKQGKYGKRTDGTEKGAGFLGELKRPDGKVSTELSVSVDFDGEEKLIPTLVPTLSEEEKKYLLEGGKPTQEIIDKAVNHAKRRMKSGKSVFAD